MPVRASLVAFSVLLCVAAVGCGGDDDAEPTATVVSTATVAAAGSPEAPATSTTASTSVATRSPSAIATATPAVPGEVGPSAVWEPTLGLGRIQEACPEKFDAACIEALGELEREDGASDEAVEFFLAHEAFLYTFEEHGTVDFGAVSSPLLNMGRPEPVFLNGAFGLLYAGEVVPSDWQEEASYADVAEALTFTEYSQLLQATADGDGQTFLIGVALLECRACEPLGALNIEVRFEDGSLQGVELLPFAPPTPAPAP
jgi:hypothetical protein